MKGGFSRTCYLLMSAVAVGLLVWGLVEVMRKRQSDEGSDGATISRQIRGFGWLMIAQLVIVVGGALCFGLSGGMDSLMGYVRKR